MAARKLSSTEIWSPKRDIFFMAKTSKVVKTQAIKANKIQLFIGKYQDFFLLKITTSFNLNKKKLKVTRKHVQVLD